MKLVAAEGEGVVVTPSLSIEVQLAVTAVCRRWAGADPDMRLLFDMSIRSSARDWVLLLKSGGSMTAVAAPGY